MYTALPGGTKFGLRTPPATHNLSSILGRLLNSEMAIAMQRRNIIIIYMFIASSLLAILWRYRALEVASSSRLSPLRVNESAANNCSQPPCGRNQSKPAPTTAAGQDPDTERYNALEDAKLQAYLLATNGSLKIRGVITILANLPRYDSLRRCLELLYNNFNRRMGYPIVIFHEANFRSRIQHVRVFGDNKQINMNSINFQQIDMSVPSWQIKKFGQPPKDVCGTSKSIGYRSMCRFQAKLVYEHPIMRHFDYHWRLDDDSLITANIATDPFAALRDGGFTYSFFQSMVDECASTTYNVTVDYMTARAIKPTFFHRLKYNEVFFNNFEVSSLKVWRSKQYCDYIEYMDSLGGFYTHRWGDAPVKTLFLSMFVPVSEIQRLRNLPYSHHSMHSPFKTNFLI